ncbi:MAG: carboxypeptidase-like regulatory domain-containing protein, partial [Ginsengibacter sp.]
MINPFIVKSNNSYSQFLSSSKFLKRIFFFFLLQMSLCHLVAQTNISGNVTNLNGEGLPGATVKLKGASVGTNTDDGGRYSLKVPGVNGTLVFSFIGYESQEINIAGKAEINVVLTLEKGGNTLSGVVVIGYGKQSREAVTTSITKLDKKVLENVPYANLASAMQGTLPGVRVQSTSGQPGAAPRVIIRGGTSINNPNGASPLYIIDGVIRTQIDNISSDDIESLQVLKDAAATAIYGARGSNGVVIITTKSGKPGKTLVSYRYDLVASTPGKLYDLASARDYITLSRTSEIFGAKFSPSNQRDLANGFGTGNDLSNNTAFTTQYLTPENEHKLNEGWESMPDPLDPSKTIIFKSTDFQDLVYRTGFSNNHFVDVSGGTKKATFNAGIGYLSADGTIITTKYDRLSFNLNGTLEVKDNLSFFGRVMYSNSHKTEPSAASSVTYYRQGALAPTAKYAFEDGSISPGESSSVGNPVYYMNSIQLGHVIDNLTMAAGAHWDILPGLSFDP